MLWYIFILGLEIYFLLFQTHYRIVTHPKTKENRNTFSIIGSRLLGDKINEETIRPRAVILLSSEPRALSKKVKSCS